MLKRERQRISYRYEGSQRWEPRNKCSHQMLDETRNSFFFRASERYAALPTPWFQRSGFQKCDTIFLWIQSPGRKAMTNLNSILKSRDITLLSKVHTVKVMVFPAVMYGCESWTIKKAERWRIDAFELWCWRRLLRVSWTARRSNQSILKEINPEYSLEGLMLKLKLQYFGHLMWKADSLEKTVMLAKTEGKRKRGRQRIRWLDSIPDSTDMSLSKLWEMVTGKPGALQSMGSQRDRHDGVTEQESVCGSLLQQP